MDYRLVHSVTEREILGISENDFKEIKKLKQGMTTILSVEEKYNMLLENYVEYEKTMLDISLNHAVFTDFSWSSFLNDIYQVSRRIINLLTSSRLYLDHIQSDVKDISSSDAAQRVKEKKSAEYDTHLSYRIMEALRNYVQHKGLPVDSMRFNTETVNNAQHSYTIDLQLKVTKLEGSGFKSSVLQELKTFGSDIELKPLIREYMDSLAAIHQTVRDELSDFQKNYKEFFESWQQKYVTATGQKNENISYLTAVSVHCNEKSVAEKIVFIAEIFPRHEWLTTKNATYTDFSMQIISSAEYKKSGR